MSEETIDALFIPAGTLCIIDAGYLDRENEIVGVLAIMHYEDGSVSALVGKGEGTDYRQIWQPLGDDPAKPKITRIK